MNGTAANILLVEDNQDHADLVMRGFRDHRMDNRIFHVPDGEAALDFLCRQGAYADAEKSPRPHLVLLDLRLPRMDGLEVLKKMNSVHELASIPVVVLTTSDSERDIAKAYKFHANSYLVKPLDFEKFKGMMDDVGGYWLAWNRVPW